MACTIGLLHYIKNNSNIINSERCNLHKAIYYNMYVRYILCYVCFPKPK